MIIHIILFYFKNMTFMLQRGGHVNSFIIVVLRPCNQSFLMMQV